MFPLLCRPHCPNISWLYTFCSFVASTLVCVWIVAHRLTGWTFGVSTTSGGSVHISRWILTRGNRSLWACRWSSFVAPHPFLSLSPIILRWRNSSTTTCHGHFGPPQTQKRQVRWRWKDTTGVSWTNMIVFLSSHFPDIWVRAVTM